MKKTAFYFLLISTVSFVPGLKAADYVNSIGIDFIKIKAGCFNMGRDSNSNLENGNNDELPRHSVCITKPFYLGKTEVTQAQWVAIMDSNPSNFKGDSHPVEGVNWDDVQRFISRLNSKEETALYRLPTEAEWEYTVRAGSSSIYHFGNNNEKLSQYAWFGGMKALFRSGNSYTGTHPVALKRPNQWGLYDMHGNVWEWVQDWYDENYYRNSPRNNPKGGDSGQYRVNRGGDWNYGTQELRSAYRYYVPPESRYGNLGFRLVREEKIMEQSFGVSTENLVGILSYALVLIFYGSLAYFWCFKNLYRGFREGYKLFKKITNGKASEHWDSIKGKIIEAHIIPSTFQVELKYSFNLNGEIIEGNRISFNERYNDPNNPNSLVNIDFGEKYPVDGEITVFYDKNNPRQNTLEKGLRISELSLSTIVMPWIFEIVFGLFVMVTLVKVPFYTFLLGLFNKLSLL